jgi:hypothetical protein
MLKPGEVAYDSFQRHYAKYMGANIPENELSLSYLPFSHLLPEIQELWKKVELEVIQEFRQK